MIRLVVAVLFALTASGCTVLSARVDPPGPRPCEELYSSRRCLAMADVATESTDHTRDDVAEILIVPDPPPSDDHIIQNLGGAKPITVRLVLLDGTSLESQMCGGLRSGPACSDEPPDWEARGDLIGAGYHDVPCAGEPPDGCATPVPSIEPRLAADAVPIVVPSRTIPIDHVGAYEVSLGTGSLPNGVLTEATYRFADPWPIDVTFREGPPRLELRSLEDDGMPFDNVYAHGWRDGLERIEAVLVFEVRRFDPGASIDLVDVEVR